MVTVRHLLTAVELGDPHAAQQLLPLVYEELRKLAAQKLAREKRGQTLQPTSPVHEAYLRLVDVEKVQHWRSRGHFLGQRPKPCGVSWSMRLEPGRLGSAAEAIAALVWMLPS